MIHVLTLEYQRIIDLTMMTERTIRSVNALETPCMMTYRQRFVNFFMVFLISCLFS